MLSLWPLYRHARHADWEFDVHMTEHSTTQILRLVGDGLWLFRPGQGEPIQLSELDEQHRHCTFAAPAEVVRLTTTVVQADERRHLAKSLPFTLEDQIIDPVEDMHFACQPLEGDLFSVGLVANRLLSHWLDLLGPLFEGPVTSEALLLPWQVGEACLLMEGDTVLVRYGNALGARIDKALLPLFLSSLDDSPASLIVYGEHQQDDLASLGEQWRQCAQWRRGGFAAALMVAPAAGQAIHLRQGTFAPRLPFARWWQHWRTVGIAATVALVLQLGADLTEYQRLRGENVQIREAIQASYRQANPRGAVVNPEKQLDQQLSEFSARSQGVLFTPILAKVTESVASMDDASISSLNFSGSTSEVRLDIVARDYQAVEVLRDRLTQQGMTATLETSSSRADRVRARIRVAASS